MPEDVTYEFRLYEGRLIANDALAPMRVLHTVRGLRETQYAYPQELTSCKWYFWTVRAKFDFNGFPRVTEWAGAYDSRGGKFYSSHDRRGSSSELPSSYLYYPFRTGRCFIYGL